MNRRSVAVGAAAGVCALLAAVLAPSSSTTSVVRTTGGSVDRELAASPLIDRSSQDTGAVDHGGLEAEGAPAGVNGHAPASSTTSSSTTHRAAPPSTKAPEPAASIPPSGLHGPLRTVGNTIVDADGRPVVLRGIQRVGFQMPGKWPPITDAEMAHARDWGATVVRLPMGEAYLDPRCTSQYVPDYLDTLDSAVHSITSLGMVALLDLSFGTRTPCGDSARWRMADASSIPFWVTIANRYKDNPLVAFDLFNEPHDISNDVWRDGGELQDPGVVGPIRWTAAGMQQLYDAVRSTGATNVITISGNSYGGSALPILDGHRVDGYNIVYATHVYTCSEPDPFALCTSNPSNQSPTIASGWNQVAAQYPVMITEFGWPNRDDGTYNARVIRLAQAQNPPWGWVAFAWSGRPNGDFALVSDINTYAPTAAGTPVKVALGSPP